MLHHFFPFRFSLSLHLSHFTLPSHFAGDCLRFACSNEGRGHMRLIRTKANIVITLGQQEIEGFLKQSKLESFALWRFIRLWRNSFLPFPLGIRFLSLFWLFPAVSRSSFPAMLNYAQFSSLSLFLSLRKNEKKCLYLSWNGTRAYGKKQTINSFNCTKNRQFCVLIYKKNYNNFSHGCGNERRKNNKDWYGAFGTHIANRTYENIKITYNWRLTDKVIKDALATHTPLHMQTLCL